MQASLNPVLKNKAVWSGLLLVMADAGVGVLTSVYSYTLVLSYYPASFLMYFIVIQTIFSSVLRTIVLRLHNNNYKKNALIQYATFIIIFSLCLFLININVYAIWSSPLKNVPPSLH
jgi:uncharacterized membrane protein HdeD (DUF308 family)